MTYNVLYIPLRGQRFTRSILRENIQMSRTEALILVGRIKSVAPGPLEALLRVYIEELSVPLLVPADEFEQAATSFKDPRTNKHFQFWFIGRVRTSNTGFFLDQISWAPTDSRGIPVASKHELAMADYLVREGRKFRKPVREDAGEEFVGIFEDFTLLDTAEPFAIEVWGLDTPEYQARKQEKEKRLGHRLISWHAYRGAALPALPPRAG